MGKESIKFNDPCLAEKLAKRIRELRNEHNHSQEYLIDHIHLDINRYEICDRVPSLMSILKICKFYNITLSEFFEPMNYPPTE